MTDGTAVATGMNNDVVGKINENLGSEIPVLRNVVWQNNDIGARFRNSFVTICALDSYVLPFPSFLFDVHSEYEIVQCCTGIFWLLYLEMLKAFCDLIIEIIVRW